MNDAAPHARSPRHYAPARPKVQPFARYKGTSAWKKHRRRARAYAQFKAASQAQRSA